MFTGIFHYQKDFTLESGVTLPGYHLGYTTYGKLNEKKNNVLWIFHALTSNSQPHEWWPGLVGREKLFDPENYFIVCVNMPGSCYGSMGPLSVDAVTGKPFFHQFPFFTPRDMVRAYQPLKDFLKIDKIKIGIGGSMGGQQLLEWAVEEKDVFENIIPIATNAVHSPWARAFNASQRMCIEADESWKNNNEEAGLAGMKVARSIALLSYRHYNTYHANQQEAQQQNLENFRSESYQKYQGEKLALRFNAFSYYFLSKSMDAQNLGRGRMSVAAALQQIKAKTLCIGITSDILFPVSEQRFIATHIPNAEFKEIDSLYGHDGFLLEFETIELLIATFFKAG